MKPERPMALLSFKIPVETLEWIDQDVARTHRANRSAWLNALLSAVMSGHVQAVRPDQPVKAAVR